jgi:hypothetical protein
MNHYGTRAAISLRNARTQAPAKINLSVDRRRLVRNSTPCGVGNRNQFLSRIGKCS